LWCLNWCDVGHRITCRNYEYVCEHETWFMLILEIDESGELMNYGMLIYKWLYDDEYLIMRKWWVMIELVDDMWMQYCLTMCKWWIV
jgi:hypothetical protein